MRRCPLLSAIFLLCLLVSPLYGQEAGQENAASADEEVKPWGYLGVRGGGQFSQVYFSDTFRPVNMNTGFVYGKQFGVIGKIFVTRHAGIQTEVNYVEKGYKQLLDSGFYSTQMDYVEVPFMMNAYLGKRKTQFFVNLGPYFEVFLRQHEKLLGAVKEGEEFYPFDPATDRTFGYGLRASGGLNRLFPFGQLQLEGGMTITISDMLVSNRLVSNVPDGSKHIVGFVSLAYMLPLGKQPD
jgi:hypothetical protein